MERKPESGAKILMFKEGSLQDILNGRKKIEVRGTNYKSGVYWFGCKGVLHAVARLGPGTLVESQKDFERLREHHLMDSLPYSRTYLFQILGCEQRKLSFHHTKGAVSIVRYRRT